MLCPPEEVEDAGLESDELLLIARGLTAAGRDEDNVWLRVRIAERSPPTAAQSSSPPSWGVPTVKPSGFGVRPLAGSFLTRRWGKADSNHRSRFCERLFRTDPGNELILRHRQLGICRLTEDAMG